MLILKIWHYFIILTMFLLCLFNHVDVHESFILFKGEGLKVKNLTDTLKISMIQIMTRPFFESSGFGCTVNFDFVSLYLRCLVDDF